MTKTSIAVTAILLSPPAFAQPDQIRARLLATPVWTFETSQDPNAPDAHGIRGKVDRGTARFVEREGKLVGYVDEGVKCDNEVNLRLDGFDFETCFGGEKRFIRTGDEFKATAGSWIYTLRPAP